MARGEGLRVRFAKIPGETPKGVLSRALVLPAVLRGFGWTEEASHTEYDTIRAGQFSQPAMGPATARRLRTPDDIETLTVEWDAPWLVEQGLDPDRVYDELFAVLRSRRPIELLATPKFGPDRPLLRMDITVRSVTSQMREGEPDTAYYTLRVSEWRDASVGRRGAGRGSKLPTDHRLAAGDTLFSLAERYYHTLVGADHIARANAIRGWGRRDPLVGMQRYRVGSKVKIPQIQRELGSSVGVRKVS